jgi:hypothetical protein
MSSPLITGASAVDQTAPPPFAHSRSKARPGLPRTGSVRSLRSMIVVATACAGAGLLVAACSGAAPAASGHGEPVAAPAVGSAPRAGSVSGTAFGAENGGAVPSKATDLTKLAPNQEIIYTANLTLRVKDVDGIATVATNDVTAVGGYVASEQEVQPTGRGGVGQVDLQLKIPVAAYHQTVAALDKLGKELLFNSQSQDVTQQVADVTSRVASAQAAIKQLRALLSRAGNVGQLLSVQDEINAQESSLEALIAQQEALAHETTYATVNVTLLGHHAAVHKKRRKKASRGLVSGLKSGWRALKLVVVWLLTALGTLLPFAVPVLVIGGIVYVGRRRIVRRRTPPAAAPPAATS